MTARSFPAILDPAPILEVCSQYPEVTAKADYGSDHLRRGRVSWVDDAPLKARMWEIVQEINATYFGFELEGILEPLQYAAYGVGDRFGWHVDMAADQKPYRKLSLSVQLSAPEDYDGGELEMQLGCWTRQMPKGRGDVIAFPTWAPHRVEPVSRGTRHALVVWAHGAPFR